jgi:hypothetical protein
MHLWYLCLRFEVLPGLCVKNGVFMRSDAVHFGSYDVCVSAEAAFFPSFVIVQTVGSCKNIFMIQFYRTINKCNPLHYWYSRLNRSV